MNTKTNSMNITKNLEISQIKRVGPKLVAIFALFAAGANAQNITWQVPQTISGASDVSTLGTYFGSWAPWDGNSTSYPVNGVTFQGNSDLQGLNDWVGKGGGPYFSSPNTPDSNYNSLLPYGQYAPDGTLEVIDWSGMTAGHTYLVQFWVEDSRGGSTASRWETLSGGAIGGTSSGIDASAQLAYSNPLNNVTAGNPGSYIIGTFVAGASGSEEILLTPGADSGSASAQVNLFQVRDITPVPEPSTVALLLGGGLMMLLRVSRRRARELSVSDQNS